MKSKKIYALAAIVAVLVIISFPSIRSVFLGTAGDAVAQSSKPLSIITDKKAPSKPDDLEAKISKGSIELDWHKSSDNAGVTGYKVYRGVSKDEVSLLALSPSTSFIDSQFESSTKYYYKVSAYDAAGNESSLSKEASIKSPEAKVLYAVPMAPNSLQARGVSTSSLNLIWKHDTSQPVTPASYKIYRNGVFVADAPYMQTPLGVGINSYFYRDTGLTPGTLYTYTVKAVSSVNLLSVDSNSISTTTLGSPDTQAPTVYVSTPSSGTNLTATATIAAVATDNIGVVGVQFTLDNVAIGQEITSFPYAMQWNTRSATNGGHALRAIARDAVGNTTISNPISVIVTNSALDPTKKPWQNFDLTKWRIQATAKPTAPTDYYLITIRDNEATDINQWFRTDPNDGSMLFWLDATKANDGTYFRTELREVMGQTNTNLNWSAQTGTSTLSATMRVAPSPTFNGAQVTLLQIHPLSGDPLVRLVWYNVANANRQLKVHYKTDAEGLVNASVYCPNTNIGFTRHRWRSLFGVFDGRTLSFSGCRF